MPNYTDVIVGMCLRFRFTPHYVRSLYYDDYDDLGFLHWAKVLEDILREEKKKK